MTADVIDAGDGLPLTIPALIRRNSETRAGAVALATDEARLTYAELDARSHALARGLLAAGAGKGSHVGMLLPNGADFLVGLLAATRIGSVALPFSTLSTPDEIRQLLVQSDTGFLLAAARFRSRDYVADLARAFPGLDYSAGTELHLRQAPWLRRIWFAGAREELPGSEWSLEALADAGKEVEPARVAAAEASVRPADRFVMIHTSGSTSTPKGVIHQHGQLLRHIANINDVRGLGPQDVLFSAAPWFWVAGFAFGLVGTLAAGARMVASNSLEAATVLDLLERERPTTTNGYAPTVNWLAQSSEYAQRDFSWLRRGNLWPILSEDARPPDGSWRHDIYGMTETGSAVAMSGDESDLPEHLRGAAGRILPGFEARVVDSETGRDCAPGEIGELWLRGPLMMEGYYGRPRSEVFDPDGWWRSSDAVAIDREGFVFMKGRLGSIIKTGGANVSPREVEAVIGEATGRLSFAVGVRDAERGQAVVAVIFAEDGHGIEEAALVAALRERLSSYKVPRRILVWPPERMPTLSSGKLDMARLLQQVEEACGAPAS